MEQCTEQRHLSVGWPFPTLAAAYSGGNPLGSLITTWQGAGIKSVKLIGDAAAPGPIAWATYAGRAWAEALDEPDRGDALPFRREIAALMPHAPLTP